MYEDRRYYVEVVALSGWEIYRENMTREEAVNLYNELLDRDDFGVRVSCPAIYKAR
jgi:hypothetical protein